VERELVDTPDLSPPGRLSSHERRLDLMSLHDPLRYRGRLRHQDLDPYPHHELERQVTQATSGPEPVADDLGTRPDRG